MTYYIKYRSKQGEEFTTWESDTDKAQDKIREILNSGGTILTVNLEEC